MKTSSLRPELWAAFLCLAAVLGLGLFYVVDRSLYLAILQTVSVQPWAHPFMDWEWVPSSVQCWAQGVNVYLDNTCYEPVPHIKFAYSPLILRAGFLPTSEGWTNAIGLGMAVLFSLSIAFLRAPRTGFATVVMVLATVSSETAFALERGNVDTLVFVFAIAGVLLWSRSFAARLAAYALFAFCGLMKFYPLALFILALRERRRDLIGIALAVGAVLAAFLWFYAGELLAALRAVPGGSPFNSWIGAMILPAGIAPDAASALGRLGFGDLRAPLQKLIWAALAGGVLLVGTRLAIKGGVRAALEDMTLRDRGMLLAGAVLMGGCFAAANSNGYRAIMLILALPGLLTLSRALPGRVGRFCVGLGCVAAPFVMWAPGLKHGLIWVGLSSGFDARASTAGMVHFVLSELAWWWLMALLLSAVIGFVLNAARELRGMEFGALSPRRPGSPAVARAIPD